MNIYTIKYKIGSQTLNASQNDAWNTCEFFKNPEMFKAKTASVKKFKIFLSL